MTKNKKYNIDAALAMTSEHQRDVRSLSHGQRYPAISQLAKRNEKAMSANHSGLQKDTGIQQKTTRYPEAARHKQREKERGREKERMGEREREWGREGERERERGKGSA